MNIAYGDAPTDNEIEITVFGPGFGEAIAVHVGQGNWFLVDSCIEPNTKLPAAHHYLQQLGVTEDRVKAIVASHWHDDHVRGISDLAQFYPTAEFFISSVFTHREALAFLSAHNASTSHGLSRGTDELYKVIKRRAKVIPVHQRSSILELKAQNRQVRVSALSPVPNAYMQSIAGFASYLPGQQGETPVNHAPELKPNLEAIAIHVDFDGDAALLGSDLEDHHRHGWSAVVSDAWCNSKTPGSVYKVAHHGSNTAEHPGIWSTLLQPEPLSIMTPFNLGRVLLPTQQDRVRIRSKSQAAYISSGVSKKPKMDAAVMKRLKDVCTKLAQVNAGFGAVRLRREIGPMPWTAELFGNARIL